jgi:hypothetical protein
VYSYEHGDETSGFIKGKEFLDYSSILPPSQKELNSMSKLVWNQKTSTADDVMV